MLSSFPRLRVADAIFADGRKVLGNGKTRAGVCVWGGDKSIKCAVNTMMNIMRNKKALECL